jgi:hypothetical protein
MRFKAKARLGERRIAFSAHPSSYLQFSQLSDLHIRLSPLRVDARRRERNRERISAMGYMNQDGARGAADSFSSSQ